MTISSSWIGYVEEEEEEEEDDDDDDDDDDEEEEESLEGLAKLRYNIVLV